MTRDWLAALSTVMAFALSVALPMEAATGSPPVPPQASETARPPIVPVAVFGEDERTAVPAHLAWVAERIGLLFNNNLRTVCTAFCVADNVVATAAHCVARGHTGHVRYADYRFGRHYDRGRELVQIEGAATGAAAQHIMSGDFRLKVRPPIDAAFDWALIRVPRNTCPAKSLTLKSMPSAEIIAESKAGRVFQISYHRDLSPWRALWSKPCTVARDFAEVKWSAIAPDFIAAEQMLLHTCDTGGASSGSPLLLEADGTVVVVGLNVGTYVQSRIVTQKGQPVVRQQAETVANTAVNIGAFASQVERFRTAQILATSAAIRDLQERLRDQSLYTGRIDGSYGPHLKTAIEAYEQASRLPITGLPTPALVQRLAQDAERSGQVAPSTGEPRKSR
jgi:protease YdgD